MLKTTIFFILYLALSTYALDDLPLYLDAGCEFGGIPKCNAQGPSDMKLASINGANCIPISCTEALTGSDAAVIKLDRKLNSGEYFDFVFKWSDDRSHSIKGYKDLHMWIKNKNNTIAKFRLAWENANYSSGTYKNMQVQAGESWQEIVVPLADLGSDSVVGLKFSNPTGEYNGPDLNADPINILIDSITVTDGTKNNSLTFPKQVINPRPAKWTSSFLVGSFDNRDLNKSTKAAQAGCPYRYQYVMPDIQSYGKDYILGYANESKSLGVKTAIVWYNLGKSGEGYGPVSANLQSATYMDDYFTRYDWVLDQLAQAGQSDYMIVIEPDMYGFIMRGEKYHPADIPVNMTKANSLSGKIYESTLTGWAKYLVERAHSKLPNGVIMGHMPNHWGVNIPGQVGQGRKEAHIMSGLTIGQFIKEFGPVGMGDVVFVEKTDHDAGHKPAGENWFWDSTGYAKYFLWTRAIAYRTGLPIAGWQVSEGNMSNSNTKLRDNAVETFLAHPQWWVDGGFIGILFGAGNGDCCNYKEDNDGGWFVQHITTYNANPFTLPVTGIFNVQQSGLKSYPFSVRYLHAGIQFPDLQNSATFQIFSLDGKSMLTTQVSGGQIIPLSNVQPGKYVYRCDSKVKTATGSFVLRK